MRLVGAKTSAITFFEDVAIRSFVDSVALHRYWGCHRLSERSFFVRGRQFHICARCTGLLCGIPCSLLLLPAYHFAPEVFLFFAAVLLTDGLTQLWGLRKSTNTLRFITGFGTSVTFLPAIYYFMGSFHG